MNKLTEKDICRLISQDPQMMEILRIVKSLNLPDCWIGAGFVRNKIWDVLHDFKDELVNDIDVAYFDKSDLSEAIETEYEQQLNNIAPYSWSVTNQARMHIDNKNQEYLSVIDAIAHWPETATCIAVKLDENDDVVLITPFGIDDLVNLRVIPSPVFMETRNISIYEQRQIDKNWQKRWPKLDIYHFDI